MKRIKACWKLGRAVLHILGGLLTILWRFPRLSQEQKEIRIQVWSLEMLACLGIKLVVTGQPARTGPMLLVANHISWLDITSLHAARYCRFVSKADVRQWPVIGALAAGVGTLFIERESRRDAMRVVNHMADSLRNGDVLAVFPEGTTSDGVSLLPFHANLFQAAISANVPVQPVAMQFIDRASGQRSLAPCYINDDTLMGSIWRTLTAPALCAVVTFGEPQSAQGRDRRTWAADVRNSIAAMRA
ncbi:lysophospholipid acyltransferase family protein [Rhodoferax sp.]|uniref:lysophospholipid acyltransferase family protein n=1 Tax=Rhodoferax sp. TaxID=50421 RepID=UPI001EB1FAE3|nr:lysophospholipid acyltransferase family protein [Rhodoferax sp.]MBT9505397.1 1-acyl-sn-glycerol-3-phosphate acyltransferase [Rhodoferax sp.]